MSGFAADVDFTRDVQPIFAQSCYSCHGPKAQLGGLRLDAKSTPCRGGQSGKAIVAGKSADSLLVQRILGSGEQARMPMGAKPLAARQDRSDPSNGSMQALSGPRRPATETAEIKKHWAFIAPKKAAAAAGENC